jgi:hypothetical protein
MEELSEFRTSLEGRPPMEKVPEAPAPADAGLEPIPAEDEEITAVPEESPEAGEKPQE